MKLGMTLCKVEFLKPNPFNEMSSYLAHEVGDDPVEGGVLEAETLLPGAESAEVLRGLGHHVSAQLNISINLCD